MTMEEVLYPRQVILVSCRAEVKSRFSPDIETKDNLITFSWHSPVSFNPELYAIMLSKKRYSYKLIKESGVFVVNFMDIKYKDEVLYCGRNTGEHIDKFKETKLEREEAEKIDCVRVEQALGFLECHVVNEVEAGDHVMIIGQVMHSLNKKTGKKIFQVKGNEFTTTK